MNNQAFRGSGLIARFVYCFPENNIGSRKYNTKPISEIVEVNYKNLIFKLLNKNLIIQMMNLLCTLLTRLTVILLIIITITLKNFLLPIWHFAEIGAVNITA
jgi:hypothetical protein